jgi:ADP-dependent NAD(P)H-hydrate dehydratase / NAD(P)H-hydrate epimerase
MIKILSNSQIKELDSSTIQEEKIRSFDLMERACSAFVDWFIQRFGATTSILIVCGTGNNGGDGLGIARLLAYMPFQIKVVIIEGSSESADFKENLKQFPATIEKKIISASGGIELPSSEIIIDALFGTGLSRPLDGVYASVVKTINQSQATIISVDIPSGLFSDAHTDGPTVRAHHTVTFQLPKLSFLLPQSHASVGECHIVDIGLSQQFISKANTNNYLIDEPSIKEIIRPRKKFGHKGDYGHSLIVAGSLGKIGANILATQAALRTGSGLVTSMIPKCGYTAIQSIVPEAMAIVDPNDDYLCHLPNLNGFTSIGIGPGIGKEKKTVGLLSSLLRSRTQPCVLDADALNILSENLEMQSSIPPNSILTPHPGEFKRLAGQWGNDFERLELQRKLSDRLRAIIVLKGAHTSIALPNGEVFFNSTGNPAMATGGSGDVLTGMITALLAQQYPPHEAAILGVYWHGLAGDMAAKIRHTIIASDIISQIPIAIKSLTSSHELQ